jgi:putative photosynthetic complex assembly protein 2
MAHLAHAALFTVFLWWFTTGAIIFLDGLPRRTFVTSMAAATVLLVVSVHGLSVTSTDTSVAGAYWAFTFALVAWGWNEMGFLMGMVTGPRTTACPDNPTGFQRLVYAIQSIAYHEVAIAVTAVVVAAVTADGANQVGFWTFMVLWGMRLSAKINVFLGVPNITEEFLPPHLKYLKSYFRKRAMNGMFPISITVITVLSAVLLMEALTPGISAYEATAFSLLFTLVALALIEHWFMVLPIPSEKLWQWGLKSHETTAAAENLARRDTDTQGNAATVGSTSGGAASVGAAKEAKILPPTAANVAVFQEATNMSHPISQESCVYPLLHTGSTIVNFTLHSSATHRRRP